MEEISSLFNPNTESTAQDTIESLDTLQNLQTLNNSRFDLSQTNPEQELLQTSHTVDTLGSLPIHESQSISTLSELYDERILHVHKVTSTINPNYLKIETIKITLMAMMVGIMVAIFIVALFIANKVSKIEKILQNAEIQAQDVYDAKSGLKFILDLKEDPETTYDITKLVQNTYAQENVFVDKDITIKARILMAENGTEIDLPLEIHKESETKYVVTGNPAEGVLTPGAYKVQVDLERQGKVFTHEQDFNWGVLSINTNKSVYLPGDLAKIQIAVLDDEGNMVCDSSVSLTITDPQGKSVKMTTLDKDIKVNAGCHIKAFVWEADYETEYQVGQVLGQYEMKLSAITPNGQREMMDYFDVRESVPFDIIRESSTRIYPRERYPVIFTVKANESYTGNITELVPRDFKVFNLTMEDVDKFSSLSLASQLAPSNQKSNYQPNFISEVESQPNTELSEDTLYKSISWNVNLERGQTYTFGYWYDAPNGSPNFYKLGPLTIGNYKEARVWQIAVDDVIELPHASVFLETDDTDAGPAAGTYEEVENTTISHATLNAAGFADTETLLIIADVNFDGNNANSVYGVRLATTAGTAIANTTIIKEPRTADNRNEIQRILIRTTKTSGQGIRLEKAYYTAGQTAPRVQKFSMSIIGLDDLTAGEDYAYDDDTSTGNIPANGSPATYATISTPSSDPDWQTNLLVMDSFRVNANNGIGADAIIHGLRQDTSATVNNSRHESEDVDDRYGGGSIYVFTQADTSAHTYDVRLQNSDASTDSFAHEFSSIIAFPSTLFEDFEYGLTAAEYNTANTSFNEIEDITPFTPQSAGDFLVLGGALSESAGTSTDDNRIRVQVGGVNIPSGFDDSTEGVYPEDGNDDLLLNINSIQSFTASSQDIDLDAATDNAASDFHERVIVAVSMGLSFLDVSGTAYTDDNEVSTLNSYSVCLAKNDTQDSDHCTTTSGTGTFTINNVYAQNGDQLTLFVDHASVHGNTVTKAPLPTSNLTGLKLYQDHVLVRAETGPTLTILDMDLYDKKDNSTDMLFTATTAPSVILSIDYGNELYVQAGQTFTPGGTVDSHDIEIDGIWTATGAEVVTLDGTFKLDAGGTLNPATSTITFDGTGATEDIITDGTGSFYNLTLNDAGGSLIMEVEDPMRVANTLTITGGTLDAKASENNQINVGNWDNDDTFLAQAGTMVFDGSGATTYTIDADGTGTDAFFNVTFNDNNGGATYRMDTLLDVDNDLTITGGTLNSNANNITLGHNWTNSDIFTEGTATVTFDGTSPATLISGCSNVDTCTNENFYNITINKVMSDDPSVSLSATHLRVTNTLTIIEGTINQGALNIRAEGASAAVNVNEFGRWDNSSTGDVTLGGPITNHGVITLNGNGDTCGDADTIAIRSTAAAQRSWEGTGAFRLTDVDVQYQAGTPLIDAVDSTDSGNNGANWRFLGCKINQINGVLLDGINLD